MSTSDEANEHQVVWYTLGSFFLLGLVFLLPTESPAADPIATGCVGSVFLAIALVLALLARLESRKSSKRWARALGLAPLAAFVIILLVGLLMAGMVGRRSALTRCSSVTENELQPNHSVEWTPTAALHAEV